MKTTEKLPPVISLIDLKQKTDVTDLVREVMQSYEVPSDDQATINTIAATVHSFTRLTGALGEGGSLDMESLQRLKCLDLACGNGSPASVFDEHLASILGPDRRKMEPWLCRVLHKAKVNVTGIDIFYPQYIGEEGKAEEWKFLKMDLTRPADLQRHFRDQTFDVVSTSHFILGDVVQMDMPNSRLNAPNIFELKQRDPRKYFRLVKDLLIEIRRMLKIGGNAFINHLRFERGEVKKLEKVLS